MKSEQVNCWIADAHYPGAGRSVDCHCGPQCWIAGKTIALLVRTSSVMKARQDKAVPFYLSYNQFMQDTKWKSPLCRLSFATFIPYRVSITLLPINSIAFKPHWTRKFMIWTWDPQQRDPLVLLWRMRQLEVNDPHKMSEQVLYASSAACILHDHLPLRVHRSSVEQSMDPEPCLVEADCDELAELLLLKKQRGRSCNLWLSFRSKIQKWIFSEPVAKRTCAASLRKVERVYKDFAFCLFQFCATSRTGAESYGSRLSDSDRRYLFVELSW